jgi:hypothetical protein
LYCITTDHATFSIWLMRFFHLFWKREKCWENAAAAAADDDGNAANDNRKGLNIILLSKMSLWEKPTNVRRRGQGVCVLLSI